MADRYPLTIDQVRQTKQSVAVMTEQAAEIAQLLSAVYGEADPKTVRAQEAHAALLRLQTEMQRADDATVGDSNKSG